MFSSTMSAPILLRRGDRVKKISRRDFIALLGCAAASWSPPAQAQQPATPVIGYLGSGSPELDGARVSAFRQGLSEAGYVEDRNVAVEFLWAAGQSDRFPALAAEFVRRQMTVIIAGGGTRSVLALKAATTTIPIVFQVAVDPVETGLVASLNRPGGNLTGIVSMNLEVEPKRLELLRELVPAGSTIALLVNPTSPFAEALSKEVRAAARSLGLQVHVLNASSERDFDPAFATMVQLRTAACVISTDSFFLNRLDQLAAASVRHAMPTIAPYQGFATGGGLMSYGTDVTESFRQVGLYTGRILKGEKPGELPVHQATKLKLVLNLKTAKTLGLTLPLILIGRADEMIE
jgi:putative ABC transport system substrate-binding protein